MFTPVFLPTAVFTVGLAASCPPVNHRASFSPLPMSIIYPDSRRMNVALCMCLSMA